MGDQMRTYKVTTPEPDHTGEVGGVVFVRGAATVEAPAPLDALGYEPLSHAERVARDEVEQHPGYRAMAYFRQAGYGVEDITPDEAGEDEPAVEDAKAKTAAAKTSTKEGSK